MKLSGLVLLGAVSISSVMGSLCYETVDIQKCSRIHCKMLSETIENINMLSSCIDVKPLWNKWYMNCYNCHCDLGANCHNANNNQHYY